MPLLANNALMRRVTVAILAILGLVTVQTTARGASSVTVRPGDTLSAIAARAGVSTSALASANGIADADMIAAGKALAVPSGGGGSASGGGYTVRPGDTLSGIATRHGVSVQSIVRANGLRNAHAIVAGTKLRIAGSAGAAPSGGGGGHSVQPGENLGAIAARYGTTAQALAQANGISDPNLVVAGTRLKVAGGGGDGGAASSSNEGAGHTVQPGENLGAIAARYGTTAQALAQANGIGDPNFVIAGTRLRVPGGSAQGANGVSRTMVTAATSGWGGHASKADVASLMAQHAARHGVDPSLVRAIGWQESGWWQGARSSTGAIGVMQLMPDTAAWAGPALLGRPIDPTNVSDNIEAGVAYLGYLQRQTGSRERAIASYYQGLGSVTSRGYYDDTKSYVASVSSFIGRV
jgi:LysM repeat protein